MKDLAIWRGNTFDTHAPIVVLAVSGISVIFAHNAVSANNCISSVMEGLWDDIVYSLPVLLKVDPDTEFAKSFRKRMKKRCSILFWWTVRAVISVGISYVIYRAYRDTPSRKQKQEFNEYESSRLNCELQLATSDLCGAISIDSNHAISHFCFHDPLSGEPVSWHKPKFRGSGDLVTTEERFEVCPGGWFVRSKRFSRGVVTFGEWSHISHSIEPSLYECIDPVIAVCLQHFIEVYSDTFDCRTITMRATTPNERMYHTAGVIARGLADGYDGADGGK